MSIDHCKLINFNKITDPRGVLIAIEGADHVPFDIKRVYYLYDISTGASRAGHAHKQLQQLIIATSGSFTIQLDDGKRKSEILLNNPSEGLYISPMIWREIYGFSSGAVCLVLASTHYSEEDYYRDYQVFLDAVKKK